MRTFVGCKINIRKVLQQTLQHQEVITHNNFNFESNAQIPIVFNNQAIGYVMNSEQSVLWLDVTPEFVSIDDKWHLSALVVSHKNPDTIEFENGSNIRILEYGGVTRSKMKAQEIDYYD